MTNIEALVASNLWWSERKNKGAHHYIVSSLPFLFQTLDALYIETRKLPLHAISGRTSKKVDVAYQFTYSIFLNPVDYAALRSILSLSGDIYEMLKPLYNLNKTELLELDAPIRKLYVYSLRFKELRNFITHLGEAMTNMNKHGISGPLVSDFGSTYTNNAKHCVYLIWENSTIYFTYSKKGYMVVIDKPSFDPVFQHARELFKELISHETRKGENKYTPIEKLYPEVPLIN